MLRRAKQFTDVGNLGLENKEPGCQEPDGRLNEGDKMKLHKTIWLTIAAIVLTVGVSNAQVKQKISDQQLADLLVRIAASTDRFTKTADKALDKSGYDGSPREDQLNRILKRLQEATEALKNDHSGANAKGNFESVLHYGVGIENWFRQYPLDGVQDDWATLRSDLGELASGFNITWDQGHAIGAPVGAVDVKSLCMHIEDVADRFKETVDSALDKSKVNNTNTEDEMNGFVREFRDATNTLQDHYNEDRAKQDAEEVLNRAKKIDDYLRKHAMTPAVQSAWVPVKTDLQRLAKFYSIKWLE
jgi:hypothetical protein